ncbi:hypothetical protein V2J09_009194 [Rumex salicifolius]
MASSGSEVEAGFAKLQGENFEYYMQTYSIVLGRNSKKSTVDVDLSTLGGGMNISRNHARIYYDFQRRRFALDVLGKNGCFVEGVLHLPGNPPVKLDSQDLLQIGDTEFYFLLPSRNILGSTLGPRHGIYAAPHPPPAPHHALHPYHAPPPALGGRAALPYGGTKKGRMGDYYEEAYEEEEVAVGRKEEAPLPLPAAAGAGGGRKKNRRAGGDGLGGPSEKKGDGRSRVDWDADDHQLMQLEEKGVVSSVATVLSDLCGPGEWMPMERLHAELMEQYGNNSRVRKYLTSEDWPGAEAKEKPWYGLLMLLRRYPEHFVINTRSKGHVTLEFVSLASLIS